MIDRSKGNICLAITGNIGAGKSAVGKILEDWGFRVLDTDRVARDMYQTPSKYVNQIKTRLGHYQGFSLNGLGGIDRIGLASIVAESPQALGDLESIIVPDLMKTVHRWIAECREDNDWSAVLIPTLFELGIKSIGDATICVAAPAEDIMNRLRTRPNFNERVVKRMMTYQLPWEVKASMSDYLIWNNGSLESLEMRLEHVLEEVKKDLL